MATNNSDNFSNPIVVSQGGLGATSQTSYSVLCGGTTSADPVQSVVSLGTNGQILTSNGSALPTWQNEASSIGALKLIKTINGTGQTTITFDNTMITSAYRIYCVRFDNIRDGVYSAECYMSWSINNGSSYLSTNNKSAAYEWFGSTPETAQSSFSYLCINSTNIGCSATQGCSGFIWLYGLGASGVPAYTGQMSTGVNIGTNVPAVVYGYNTGTPLTINNISFNNVFYNNGNFVRNFNFGSISLYGLVQ